MFTILKSVYILLIFKLFIMKSIKYFEKVKFNTVVKKENLTKISGGNSNIDVVLNLSR